MRRIRYNGKIATAHRARKEHNCPECRLPILPGKLYWSVESAGSGVKGMIAALRIHRGKCLKSNLRRERYGR